MGGKGFICRSDNWSFMVPPPFCFYRNANLSQWHQSLGAFVRGAKGSGEMLGVEEMRFGFLLIVLSVYI